MKLSKAQQEVVDKMREGWDIHYNTNFGSCRLRHNLYSAFPRINPRVFTCLESKKVIEQYKYSYPTRVYRLTEQYKNEQK